MFGELHTVWFYLWLLVHILYSLFSCYYPFHKQAHGACFCFSSMKASATKFWLFLGILSWILPVGKRLTFAVTDVELVDLFSDIVFLNRLCSGHRQWEATFEVLHFVHVAGDPGRKQKTKKKKNVWLDESKTSKDIFSYNCFDLSFSFTVPNLFCLPSQWCFTKRRKTNGHSRFDAEIVALRSSLYPHSTKNTKKNYSFLSFPQTASFRLSNLSTRVTGGLRDTFSLLNKGVVFPRLFQVETVTFLKAGKKSIIFVQKKAVLWQGWESSPTCPCPWGLPFWTLVDLLFDLWTLAGIHKSLQKVN